MQIIYEPAGRAREYSELAANLYRGCDQLRIPCFIVEKDPAKCQRIADLAGGAA
jgi:hypothetical protein